MCIRTNEQDSLLPKHTITSSDEEDNVPTKPGKYKYLYLGAKVAACALVVLTWKAFPTLLNAKPHVDGYSYDDFLDIAMRFDEDVDKTYVGTQFISFTINTVGGSAEHGECEDFVVDPETGTCYIGDWNMTNDVFQRVALIERFLDRLKNDEEKVVSKINNDTSILKIVMIPEFFMRGPHGAYATTQMIDDGTTTPGLLIEAAAMIRDIIADDYFEDFLFVFGTATYAQVDDDQPEKPWWEYDKLDATEILYYNFAPIFKGGTNHNHFYIIGKKYFSVGDFLGRYKLPDPTMFKMRNYATIHESKVLTTALEEHGITLVDNNLLEIDGIRIGIEICLDHLMGTLWNSLQSMEDELVDVHLITSAGMAIELGPTPVVPGGVVYMCDGEASSAACLRSDYGLYDPEKVCRVPPNEKKHLPAYGGDGFSTFITLQTCIDEENVELLDGFFSRHQPQGCANTLKQYGIDVMENYVYYPPSIEIYPTVDLPRRSEYNN